MKSIKKIGGTHAFFRDNQASILKKISYIVVYFKTYGDLNISETCVVTPNFPLLRSSFPE